MYRIDKYCDFEVKEIKKIFVDFFEFDEKEFRNFITSEYFCLESENKKLQLLILKSENSSTLLRISFISYPEYVSFNSNLPIERNIYKYPTKFDFNLIYNSFQIFSSFINYCNKIKHNNILSRVFYPGNLIIGLIFKKIYFEENINDIFKNYLTTDLYIRNSINEIKKTRIIYDIIKYYNVIQFDEI